MKSLFDCAGPRVFASTRKAIKERDGQPGMAVFKNVAELDRYLAARQRSHLQND